MPQFLEVIEFFDQAGDELVHRIPEEGSGETKFGSQLVVRENQTAVFFRDGKAYDVLGPGRHTLSTQNIPFLTKFLTSMVGFGPKSPFRVEVYFVNMKVFTQLKWGTREPVAFRDSELGLVRLRAFGNYTMKVKQPLLFINTIVGTQGIYRSEQIHEYLKDVIVARLNDLLGETLDTVFNLPKIYDELGVAAKTRVQGDFDKYGLELIDFFIQSITPPEEVQKIIDDRSAMGAVGDMGKFMQFKAAKAMGDAAKAGEGGAGGTAAAGMGVGVGAGLGMMVPGMVMSAMAGAQPQAGAKVKCPGCGTEQPASSKFCSNCGTALGISTKCPKCGTVSPGSPKFCPNCGQALTSSGAKCSKCGAELPLGSKFCPNCGNKVE